MIKPAALTVDVLLADRPIQKILACKGYTRTALLWDLRLRIAGLDTTLPGEARRRLANEVASFRRKALAGLRVKNRAPKSPPVPGGVPTVVYRHFDADDRLLYVGVTHDVKRRLKEHRQCSPWAPLIAGVAVVEFPSRSEALRAERKAIAHENPIHNVSRPTPSESSEVPA